MTGIGTFADPWDLNTALNDPGGAVPIGTLGLDNSLWMKDGVYNVDTISSTNALGIAGKPMIVKPISRGAVQVNGSIALRGGYAEIRDLEIYDADFIKRDTLNTGSAPPDIPTTDGLGASASHVKFINCIIHDCRQGILTSGGDIEVYGCVIYYNGWSAPDRGHGHGIYSANSDSALSVLAKHNIVFWQFGWGLHFYTSGANPAVENMQAVENICFENGQLYGSRNVDILLGGASQAWPRNGLIQRNEIYQRDMTQGIGIKLGDGAAGSEACTVQDNYVAGGLNPFYFVGNNWGVNTITGNTWIGTPHNDGYFPDNTTIADYPAVGQRMIIHPNAYRNTRAHVAIYNWTQTDSVTVDLSTVTGLAAGDSVNVANVQDLFVDIVTLMLDESKQIAVDMRAASHTVATPQGWPAPTTTFPRFGCFVIERI